VSAFLSALLPLPSAAQTSKNPAAGARTFHADSFWVRTWTRGGSAEDDLVIEPRAIVATTRTVSVLDLGSREIVAFDYATGKTLFTKRATGSGPGEFKRPVMLFGASSSFGVLDLETARLSMYSDRGALIWDTPIADAFDVEGGCVRAGAALLLKTSGTTNALRVVDSSGRITRRLSLPRAGSPRPATSFATSARVVGPLAQDRCAIVPIFGSAWYSVDAVGTLRAHRYVDAGADADITVSTKVLESQGRDEVRKETQVSKVVPVANGAVGRGDTVIVSVDPTPRRPYPVLDYYLLPQGRYLYSRKLPTFFAALAMGPDGTLFGTTIGTEYSQVIAFKPSRTPSAPRKK
jgi:hypothetical protein